MKKRYIALIAIPTACLLFASLIYCAISSFPELLEFNKEEEEADETKEAKQLFVEEDIVYDDCPKQVNEPVVVVDVVETTDTVYSIEFDEVEIPSMEVTSIENNTPITVELNLEETVSVKELPVAIEQVVEENVTNDIIEEVLEEVVDIVEEVEPIEEVNYISPNRYYVESVSQFDIDIEEKENKFILADDEEIVVFDTVAAPTNKHYEVLECTLLVIGIVDLLSLLLIRRKKSRTFHV